MKRESSMDKTLETILEVAKEMEAELSETLLTDYYQLQKDNQFREERTLVMGDIRKLIADAVAKSVSNGDAQ